MLSIAERTLEENLPVLPLLKWHSSEIYLQIVFYTPPARNYQLLFESSVYSK